MITNDHNLYLEKVWLHGVEGRAEWGSNSAKSSNDFSSETTGHILMKLVHNDHMYIVVGDKNLYLKMVLSPESMTVVPAEIWCSGDC